MTTPREVSLYGRSSSPDRAAAVSADGLVGEVATATYLLGDAATRYGATPVVSLCAEWADLFDNTNAWSLPLIDQSGIYIGMLSKSHIFKSYRSLLKDFSED